MGKKKKKIKKMTAMMTDIITNQSRIMSMMNDIYILLTGEPMQDDDIISNSDCQNIDKSELEQAFMRAKKRSEEKADGASDAELMRRAKLSLRMKAANSAMTSYQTVSVSSDDSQEDNSEQNDESDSDVSDECVSATAYKSSSDAFQSYNESLIQDINDVFLKANHTVSRSDILTMIMLGVTPEFVRDKLASVMAVPDKNKREFYKKQLVDMLTGKI